MVLFDRKLSSKVRPKRDFVVLVLGVESSSKNGPYGAKNVEGHKKCSNKILDKMKFIKGSLVQNGISCGILWYCHIEHSNRNHATSSKRGRLERLFSNLSKLCSKALRVPSLGVSCVIPITMP